MYALPEVVLYAFVVRARIVRYGRRVSELDVRDAPTVDLDASTLYRVLRLRSEVFVVEQACVYLDADGLDLLPGARQLWVDRDGDVVATLRMVPDGADWRIGRVCTAPSGRSGGVAAALMRRAVELSDGAGVVLDAQSHLQAWYERLGFVRDGAEYVEDGIAHVPMRLPASATGRRGTRVPAHRSP